MADSKQAVGKAAAALVENGMRVGLGTGSTAAHFIRELGRRVQEEGLRIECVSSSFQTTFLARENGLPLLPLEEAAETDFYADGADEVSPAGNLLKGRGAAMVRERILAAMSGRFVVMVEEGKRVDRLGLNHPVPVEILPIAFASARRRLEALGGGCVLRQAVRKDGPVITDQGNFVLDVTFSSDAPGSSSRPHPLSDPLLPALDAALRGIPGLVGHGLFIGMAHTVLVAAKDSDAVRSLS